MTTPGDDPLLSMVLNLSKYHRTHEKFYAESPLHDANRRVRGWVIVAWPG